MALDERLRPDEAKRLIRELILGGRYSFSSHAWTEMEKDELTDVDCVNVLRAGIVKEPEWRDGSWRYEVWTPNGIHVVVAFESREHVRLVTAWREKR